MIAFQGERTDIHASIIHGAVCIGPGDRPGTRNDSPPRGAGHERDAELAHVAAARPPIRYARMLVMSPISPEYATAMCCIVLQVPNNYLPILQR